MVCIPHSPHTARTGAETLDLVTSDGEGALWAAFR